MSQGTLVDVVHGQPAGAVTATDPVVAADVRATEVGLVDTLHAMPAWLTVKVALAIVIVPVRGVASGFGATLYETFPMPVPLAPSGIVIHGTELVAVHPQVLPVLIPTVRSADADVSDTLVVDSTVAQPGADCVTVNARPPIVSVAVLELFVVLAEIE